jgi:hypothetical protein
MNITRASRLEDFARECCRTHQSERCARRAGREMESDYSMRERPRHYRSERRADLRTITEPTQLLSKMWFVVVQGGNVLGTTPTGWGRSDDHVWAHNIYIPIS